LWRSKSRQLRDEAAELSAASRRRDGHDLGERAAERNQRGLRHFLIGTGVDDLLQSHKMAPQMSFRSTDRAMRASVQIFRVFRLAPRTDHANGSRKRRGLQ